MNLVEDFDALRSSAHQLDGLETLTSAADATSYGPNVIAADAPVLTVETSIRQAARGRGYVVHVAAACEQIFIATSRCFVIRYSWDDSGNEKVSEVEVIRGAGAKITHLAVDPGGCHVLVGIEVGGELGVAYIHRRSSAALALTKLKGWALTAVAWAHRGSGKNGATTNSGQVAEASNHFRGDDTWGDEHNTGAIILGSESGQLSSVICGAAHLKGERIQPTALFDLRGTRICGIEQAILSSGRRLVAVATPTSLYFFVGGPSLASLFGKYNSTSLKPVLSVTPDARSAGCSVLTFIRQSASELPTRYAWMVGSVVMHGGLKLGDLPEPGAEVLVLDKLKTLPLPSNGNGSATSSSPPHEGGTTCMVATPYHFIIASGDRLMAVNRISGLAAAEVSLRTPLARHVTGEAGEALLAGLVHDEVSGSMYMFSDESVAEVSLLGAERGLWRDHLNIGDYEAALEAAQGVTQRDEVHAAAGDAAMETKNYVMAASHYAKVVGGRLLFEDVALKLMECGEPAALRMFLATKLEILEPTDRAQATMVAAWLTELYLDQINRALLESSGAREPSCREAEAALRQLLTQHTAVLDVGTTVALLAGYGRLGDVLEFAAARGDTEAVMEALVSRPDGVARALSTLRSPSTPATITYAFAPLLLSAAPAAMVDVLVAARPPLDPSRLMPALLRFGEPRSSGVSKEDRMHVLRYVEYAINELQCNDPPLHNLAVALYSLVGGRDGSEGALMRYLERGRNERGPLYDPKFALRLASSRGLPRCCVALLVELGMWGDAVALALKCDLELAKDVAGKSEEDTALQRRLWLAIAKHVVQSPPSGNKCLSAEEGVKAAVDLLKVAGGVLVIEDVLPFFPDFATIDNFKEAICESLERYEDQIARLKEEMEEATEIAEAVRRDLAELSGRCAVVSGSESCARCGRPITAPPPPNPLPSGGALPPFYLFPTGLAFHSTCCAAEVAGLVGPEQQAKIKALMTRLSRTKPGAKMVAGGPNNQQEDLERVAAALANEIACEDPYNGEVTVTMIDCPFVTDADKDELRTFD